MDGDGGRPIRIAHAYGNRRDTIDRAGDADIDFMEADLWYRGGEVWIRHERRLGCLPLLFDRRPRGVNNVGTWAVPVLLRYYMRLDVDPLRLTELLERTEGKCGLLLDIKGSYGEEGAAAYARTLARTLDYAQRRDSVIVCGGAEVLDQVRLAAPDVDVRHSIEKPQHWEGFLRRLESDSDLRGVCMAREFLNDEIMHVLKERGLRVFCWTIDDPTEARRLVERGADGITSNSIPLLEQLGNG